MLKKTITYTDFNGNEQSEDHYFNLTKVELIELQVSTEGGFSELLQSIITAQDGKGIIQAFKDIILMSYGIKSEDGKRFEKSDELRTQFSQTAAFNSLFLELSTDESSAAAFVQGIVPDEMKGDFKAGTKDTTLHVAPATDVDLVKMSREELLEAFKNKSQQ